MKYDQCKKDFVRKVQRMSGKYSPRDIFNDFYLKREKPILETCNAALALESPPEPKIDVKIEPSGQMAFNF